MDLALRPTPTTPFLQRADTAVPPLPLPEITHDYAAHHCLFTYLFKAAPEVEKVRHGGNAVA